MTLDASDVTSGTWVNQKVDIDASYTLSSSFSFRFATSGLVLFDYANVDDIILRTNLTANVVFEGKSVGDEFGYSVSDLGDVNNDNIDDVVVGAPFNDDNHTSGGAIYVFLGSSSPSSTIAANDADYTHWGNAVGERLGHSVGAARKIDKSVYYAVLAGAPYADPSSNTDIGKAYAYSLVPEYQYVIMPVVFMLLTIYFIRITRRRKKGSK
jgi:hypothetical protein